MLVLAVRRKIRGSRGMGEEGIEREDKKKKMKRRKHEFSIKQRKWK